MVTIRSVSGADAAAWLKLRCALWPDGTRVEHRREIEAFLSGQVREPQAVLLAVDQDDRTLGFVELSVRPYAEGCNTNQVAYLEGWYVVPDARGRGVGRSLVSAAEAWGREQGCKEFASDAQPDNAVSRRAHVALGFEEVGMVVCFRKDLDDGGPAWEQGPLR